jgi:hypothetical protein
MLELIDCGEYESSVRKGMRARVNKGRAMKAHSLLSKWRDNDALAIVL